MVLLFVGVATFEIPSAMWALIFVSVLRFAVFEQRDMFGFVVISTTRTFVFDSGFNFVGWRSARSVYKKKTHHEHADSKADAGIWKSMAGDLESKNHAASLVRGSKWSRV